jgi:hypothetical protein
MTLKDDPAIKDILFRCTMCGGCDAMDKGIRDGELIKLFKWLRQKYVSELGPIPEHRALLDSIKNYDNVWLQPRTRRNAWAKEMNIKDLTKDKAEVILFTGWTPIDPLLSVLVALIILKSGWQIVSEAGHILLEGAPHELDTRRIAPDIVANVKGVKSVHHVHVWSITQERRMVTLHACVAERVNSDIVVKSVKDRLKQKFGLDHATVEIERGVCADAAPKRVRKS